MFKRRPDSVTFTRIRMAKNYLMLFGLTAAYWGCGHTHRKTSAGLNVPVALADHWKLVGEAINQAGYDILGSSPVYDDAGKIHLYAARWQETNSFESG